MSVDWHAGHCMPADAIVYSRRASVYGRRALVYGRRASVRVARARAPRRPRAKAALDWAPYGALCGEALILL